VSRFDVHCPLSAPGDLAADALERLEEQLDASIGLGSDHVVNVSVEAPDRDTAKERVFAAIQELGAAHYFDLAMLGKPQYVSTQRYRIRSGDLGELRRRLGDGFAPLVTSAPGFRAWYFVELGDDTFLAVRVFERQAGMEEVDRRAHEWVHEHLEDLGLEVLDLSEGDVLVSREAPEREAQG
jgi:hypothetical protein